MELLYNNRTQILVIIGMVFFLFFISRKIFFGKLREEYSIIWLVMTLIILIFSIWREGIVIVSNFLGIYEATNLIFTVAIFFIYVYLIHLSIVNTKLHAANKSIVQKLAIIENKIEEMRLRKEK